MDTAPSRRWSHARSLALLGLAVAGCPHGQTGDDGEDFAIVVQAVTCDPAIERYPIAAPHNGGYDRAWSNFTCAPHPGGSPDNSDYGGDHHGNDLFAPRGSPIVAVRAGRVTRSGEISPTSGLRVTIEDACGWNYYFGHLDSIAPGIAPGVRVVAGQVIGTLGDTGTTGTAPHLHFNVHRDGNYSNDVDPYPLLRAADATACDPTATVPGTPPPQTCSPRCEGTRLVSRDCGRGDCAAYGASCVDDTLGPRCVFFACPAVGEQDTCWLGRHIGHCRNGQLVSQGDCGAYGAACVQEGTSARCASPSCSARGEYDACIAGRYITRCRNGVASPPGDCGAFGATCVDDNLGARCVFFACPAQGERDTCWLGRYRGRCFNGHLTAQADCGAQDGACVTDDLGSRCTSTICPGVRGEVRFCVAPGRIAHCTDGLFDGYEADCTATGATCANESPTTARCVPPGGVVPPPFDAGPPPAPADAGPPPDLGFALPDAWMPLTEDAALPAADVSVTADVPPAGDVPLPDDVKGFFVPDAGAMAAEVITASPPTEDDGKDPCAICRPLGRCPPQCDADGGGATADTGGAIVGPGCSCRAAGSGTRGGGKPGALVCALGLALLRRRATSPRRRSPSRG